MTACFCTYFDENYLSRGLTLYRSLVEHVGDFTLFVLCMDENAYDALKGLALPRVKPISLRELEYNDPTLLAAKRNRSRIEYYFTCTPALPVFIFEKNPDVDLITYLDADLFFFSSPAPLFEELGTGSVGIIGHRFSSHLHDRERYGLYNVGWLSFRRDANALSCLRWWRERCIEWCFDREEGGKFADQKYLDEWPRRFQGVVVLDHPGGDVAPWNLDNYPIRVQQGKVMVGDAPLIFFHFHGLKQIGTRLYDPAFEEYQTTPSRTLTRSVYLPYIHALRASTRSLLDGVANHRVPSGVRSRVDMPAEDWSLWRVIRGVRRTRNVVRAVIAGTVILSGS